MRSIDLITKINHLSDPDEVFAHFRAIRQDKLIWEGFEELSQQEGFEQVFSSQGYLINPGTLALYALDPEVQFDHFQVNLYSHELFEQIMLGYEDYIAGNTAVSHLQEAGRLALALLEKNKVAGQWKPVLAEIITRTKVDSSLQLCEFWGAPLAILANLTDKYRDLLGELLDSFNPYLTIDVLLHTILCLPLSTDDLVNTLQGFLTGKPPKLQSHALKSMVRITERSLVQKIAQKLLEDYVTLDLQPGESRKYWENPESSTEYALKCQSVADLAEFAGEKKLALLLAGKSVEILNAISAVARIKQSALKTDGQTPAFSEKEMEQQDFKNELVFTTLAQDLQIDPESPVYPVKQLDQSKRMKTAGNEILASNEISGIFSKLSDEEIEKTLVKGPRLTQAWDCTEMLNSLVESGDFDEAIRMAQIVFRSNPVSKAVNLAAAKAFICKGDFKNAVERLEFLRSVDPDNLNIKRDLVQVYVHTDSPDQAYAASKELVEGPTEPNEEDVLVYSGLAINHGNLEDAQERLAKILEETPQNARAMTLLGIAYFQRGDYVQAEANLNRATDVSDAEVKAWILRSEILARKGEGERAIAVLKQGMAANPGNHELLRANAMLLMAHEKLAEAYPVLRDLSREGKDHDVDLQLIKAMKSLGIADFREVIETLSRRYPDDMEIQGEYGTSLILTGDKAGGLSVLKSVKQSINLKPDWALAFVEARIGAVYSRIQQEKPMSANDQAEVLEILEGAISGDTDNLHTGVLKGEFYLQTGQSKKAFDQFSDLVDLTKGEQTQLALRVLAGLAESAGEIEKLDIAKAAISEALEREPDWDGLIKLRAEILQKSGSLEDAYKTARFAQATGPVYLEKLDWFIRFLTSIDKNEEAQIELRSALEANPDDIGIQLLYADQVQAVNPDESAKTLMAIKEQLATSNNSMALLKAAVLFEKQSSHELAEECLVKATDLGDDSGRLNLAGYLYKNLRYHEAAQKLEEISGNNDWIALLTADTLFSNDEILKAYQSLPTEGKNLPVLNISPEFLPESWNLLMNSSSPLSRQTLSMDLKSGVQPESIQMAKDWAANGESVEAIVFALETSLAAGDWDLYDKMVHSAPVMDESVLSTHFQFLKIESELDSKSLETAKPLFQSLSETEKGTLLGRLLHLRFECLQGERWECEQNLDNLRSEVNEIGDLPQILRLAVWRNLIKTAMSIEKYQEAYESCQKALQESSGNQAFNYLRLESFVSGIEFRNAASLLEVTAHVPFAGKTTEELSTELSLLSASFGEKPGQEIHRMIQHGRLAIAPTQEDLRELAQITPDAWDASAMMAGLRVSGQTNLARQIARKFMQDPHVCFEFALCDEQENLNRAIEVLNSSLVQKPDQPLALALMSQLLEKAADVVKAAAAMEGASSLWPNEVNWQLRNAELSNLVGNVDKTVKYLEAAHHLAPDDLTIQEKLGKAYSIARKPDQTLQYLEPLVRQDPQRADLWMSIADAYSQTNNLEMALLTTERACEITPDSNAAHLQAARVHFQRGDLERAIEQSKVAISLSENDPEGHVFLARLFQVKGDKLSALESLEHASRCPEVSVKTLVDHAQLMREINGDAAARDLIKSFSRQYPENPELLGLLAEAEETCGNLKQAELAAKKVLELRPEETGMTRFLGRIQQKSGNLDQAAYFLSQAIARDPQNADDYVELSKIFVQQREFEKARKVLEDGIRCVPGHLDLYLVCAGLLKDAKDYHGAESVLRKASAIDPRNLAVQRQLGAVLALNLVHRAQEVSTQQ